MRAFKPRLDCVSHIDTRTPSFIYKDCSPEVDHQSPDLDNMLPHPTCYHEYRTPQLLTCNITTSRQCHQLYQPASPPSNTFILTSPPPSPLSLNQDNVYQTSLCMSSYLGHKKASLKIISVTVKEALNQI